MEPLTLEQILRNHIALPAYPSSKGWYPVLCKVCNDHGRKGDRGAFKFNGDVVGYHCFNCGHGATYDPNKDEHLSKNMKIVLRSFGVPEEEWQQVLFASLANRDKSTNKTTKQQTFQTHEPKELKYPDTFYSIKDADPDDKWAIIARHYLTHSRGIDPDSHPFMLSHKTKEKHLKKWMGRLIIPMYKNNKLIFYQGRDLTDNKMLKYESPSTDKSKVLGGFDRIFEYSDSPLYVAEGWFDGESVDGCSVLGNTISDSQCYWLNKSSREKVYIPDRFGDGYNAGKQALEFGWSISTPDIGNCKDINEAVLKYGKLYVLKTLKDNTATGFKAETNLKVYCKLKK